MMKRILIPLLASLGLLLVAVPAYASTPLSGWGWSSTIGWVSFNSSDSGAGRRAVQRSDIDDDRRRQQRRYLFRLCLVAEYRLDKL